MSVELVFCKDCTYCGDGLKEPSPLSQCKLTPVKPMLCPVRGPVDKIILCISKNYDCQCKDFHPKTGSIDPSGRKRILRKIKK